MPRVFISYRRSSSSVLANLIHAELAACGITAYLDDRAFPERGSLPGLLRREIENSTIMVVLLSHNTLQSRWVQEEIELGHRLGLDLIPVYDEDYEPPIGELPESVNALQEQSGVQFFTRHGTYVREAVERLISLIRGGPFAHDLERPQIELDALPHPMSDELIGRDAEKRLIRDFLESDIVSVVSVVAFAGSGKSALVDSFLADLAPDYAEVDRVFGWHFFSQEEQSSSTSNSTEFWEKALNFFGHHGPIPVHETDKSRELYALIRRQRIILVLDALEPLQNPPHVQNGHLSDKAMQVFLTSVARDGLQPGSLIVLTSRQPVVELGRFRHSASIDLAAMDRESGSELLKSLGVQGADDEISRCVEDYRGHALSLVLLARILTSDYQGDVLESSRVELLHDAPENGVSSILSYYSRAWSERDPEFVFMYLASLFRRPMRRADFDILRERASAAETLQGMTTAQINRTITHLQKYGLIIAYREQYDMHALIRRHFSSRFSILHADSYAQAHSVLFDYFSDIPNEEFPVGLEGLDPLYRAIYHGCMAGRYSDSLDLYWRRVSRGREFYSQKAIGAFGADLAAISSFFPNGWDAPVAGDLPAEQRAMLQGLASYELTALGRLTTALRPRYAEIAIVEALDDRKLLSSDLRNLVQILLPLGRLAEALTACQQAVDVAERLGGEAVGGTYSHSLDGDYVLASALAHKATVLHRMARNRESRAVFERAELAYGKPLDRINGFYYTLLLAEEAENDQDRAKLLDRAHDNLQSAHSRENLGDIGTANMELGIAEVCASMTDAAELHLDRAIEVLQRANRIDRLPYALIERARLYRNHWLESDSRSDLDACERLLDETEQIIDFSGMTLFQVDLCLLRAEMLVDRQDIEAARLYLRTTVAAGIGATGYRLRSDDVDALQQRIRHLERDGPL